MKGKIKLELIDTPYCLALALNLKIKGELFYWHTDYVIDSDDILQQFEGEIEKKFILRDEFYIEVIKYISDINNIKRDGEKLMKEVLEDKVKELVTQSKEEQAKKLLKELKKPITIEIKD